jgi:hypothetical protein
VSPERPSFWHHFLHPQQDFMGLLESQLDLALGAVGAFVSWCDSLAPETVDQVYRLEKDADAIRVAVLTALRDAFETPFDREDVDDLSRSIDDIVDGVRNALREAVALRIEPDVHLRGMVGNIQSGVVTMRQALQGCRSDRGQSQRQASEARHMRRINERIYTQAMVQLLDENDYGFKTVLRQREGYRQAMELTMVLELAAERLQHALNKLA